MSITGDVYKNLIREYDEKRLQSQARSRSLKEHIEEEIPRLKEIEGEIASLHVKNVSAKLRGASFEDAPAVAALLAEKKALLAAHGYSEADLLEKYECPLCQDTGFTSKGPCSCFKRRLTDILYESSNIKEVLKEENFSTFSFEYYSNEPIFTGSSLTQKELAQRAYNTARAFVSDFPSSQENLFINGGCGTGKTFLSNCIAKEVIEAGYFVVYLSASKLFDILSSAVFEKDESARQLAKHIYDCDLLIIDDLGSELSNSFTSSALFGCINERLTQRSHTIISTNLTAKQLKETYSERIFSRIANRYIMIKLLASDIRMKKRLEI